MAREASGLPSIQVIYEEQATMMEDGAKGLFTRESQTTRRVANLDLTQFTSNLQAFCRQVGSVFDGVTTAIHNFEINSFELTLDVTAKGEVRFIGSVGTEVKGGLKVVFHKKEQAVK